MPPNTLTASSPLRKAWIPSASSRPRASWASMGMVKAATRTSLSDMGDAPAVGRMRRSPAAYRPARWRESVVQEDEETPASPTRQARASLALAWRVGLAGLLLLFLPLFHRQPRVRRVAAPARPPGELLVA